MNKWDTVPFGDLYLVPSRNGLTRPSNVRGSGYKMVNMGELFTYPRLKNPEMELVNLREEEKSAFSLRTGDLLFARQSLVLEGAGKCSIVIECEENTVFESHLIRVRLDTQKYDPLFYFYFFSSELGLGTVQTIVRQVAAAGIRGSDLERLKVICPSLPVQRKIAAILSAYDDLIENNTRRIAMLEKMAEEVYREWFVRLRFPGHESVSAHQGVPEGWETIPVADAFEITGGGTPSKEENRFWEGGGVNWYTPTDITAAEGMFLATSGMQCTEEGLSNSSARLFPPYSLMMTSRATIGALGINTTPACTNQGFITCIPNDDFAFTYLYFWLKLNKSYFEILSTGSTFLELIKSNFRKIKIIKPSRAVAASYHKTILPVFKMVETLLQDKQNLKSTRDMLLSRLLSGKLDVEDLDIQFPPGMNTEAAAGLQSAKVDFPILSAIAPDFNPGGQRRQVSR